MVGELESGEKESRKERDVEGKTRSNKTKDAFQIMEILKVWAGVTGDCEKT